VDAENEGFQTLAMSTMKIVPPSVMVEMHLLSGAKIFFYKSCSAALLNRILVQPEDSDSKFRRNVD
jgi:hypothetical protein